MKIKCACGNDITSMKGCLKIANKYFCNKCNLNITKQKLEQLALRIKDC